MVCLTLTNKTDLCENCYKPAIRLAPSGSSPRLCEAKPACAGESGLFLQRLFRGPQVSVLFNEPKLLKSRKSILATSSAIRFSALQRAEIAEIDYQERVWRYKECFSALQRAEIAEIF